MMSVCERSNGKTDGLDELITDFMAWQQHTSRLSSENHALMECIAEKDKQLKDSDQRYCVAKQEQRSLQDVVTQLQEILKKRCDLEDQNITLSSEIAELKEEMKEKEKRQRAEVQELRRAAEDMQLAHSAEVTDTEEACKKKAAEEKEALSCRMKASRQLAEQLEQQVAAQERDKQAQLVKLRLEYDAKLLKLQTKTAKQQQHTSQGAGATQDIFRKKLQHQRDEYEQRIRVLQKQVSELEQQKMTAAAAAATGQSMATASAACKRRKVNFHRS